MLIKVCNELGLSADYVLFGQKRSDDKRRLDSIDRISPEYIPLIDKAITELLSLSGTK